MIPFMWPKSRTLTTPNAGENVKQQDLLFIVDGSTKLYSHFGRHFGVFFFFYKAKHTLKDPAIVLLGMYPKGLKIYAHTKTCTSMFIAALFIIAKTWKQLNCPSVGE